MDRDERIKKFMQDERTSNYVFEEVRDYFLKSRGTKDVYVLAGERIALELLEKAWEKLKVLRDKETENTGSYKQIGL